MGCSYPVRRGCVIGDCGARIARVVWWRTANGTAAEDSPCVDHVTPLLDLIARAGGTVLGPEDFARELEEQADAHELHSPEWAELQARAERIRAAARAQAGDVAPEQSSDTEVAR